MPADKTVIEANLKASDLDGMEEVRISSVRNMRGDELATKSRLIADTPRGTNPPSHHRPTLTVFIDDPDDNDAGDRIKATLGISPRNGWHSY